MKQFFKHDLDFFNDLIYFFKKYENSLQGEIQLSLTSTTKEMFEQAVYCFLTPATKSDSSDLTHKELFTDDFFYKASLEELTYCLRKPPYIRFHNQKAARLLLWQQNGMDHIQSMLLFDNARDKRQYLVNNVKGMNFKEATHFLRNVGCSEDLVILDRHIINFMKDVYILSEKDDMSKLSKNYLVWEKLFVDFINSPLWIDSIGKSTIPRADFAIWASRVKKADSSISYERILMLR